MQTADNNAIFVIIPVYNEAPVIWKTVTELLETGHQLVVVDDGSTDGSLEVISSLPVHLLSHPINLGQGAALQTGMEYAVSRGADYVVHFDADGQHRISDIETLLEVVQKGEAEVVLGSRFLRAKDAEEIPVTRRWVLKVAIFVNYLMTGMWLSDTHNGLRAMTREAAKKIILRENRYSHASEIIHEIKVKKLKVIEKPVRIRYTKYSRQKGQSLWNAFNIVIDMMLRGIFK